MPPTSVDEPPTLSAANEPLSPGSDESPPADSSTAAPPSSSSNANVPKPKRLACTICRKRKLRCDGIKPSCSTCTRLGHSCAYDEVRRKSGPKRGYVKALEERLKQVERLLNTQEPSRNASADVTKTPTVSFEPSQSHMTAATANYRVPNPNIAIASDMDLDGRQTDADSSQNNANNNVAATATSVDGGGSGGGNNGIDDFSFGGNMSIGMNHMNNFTWEMIGLGLEEPLPPQETIDELAPNQRPPVALRYAVWTQACSNAEKYADLKELFYQRARKYVEADYIKGYGEHMISVAHAQTHALLASYEFKMMYFPRAWQSTGQAVRLCQMIGLHRLDHSGLEVKQCLPGPRDWTEREERRRTFWMAFCLDRYASIGTGWPMSIDERDVMTNLPATEGSFDMSRPEQTQTLAESTSLSGAAKLSSFGSIVLMACLFGRNLVHLHRPDADDRDHDLNGEFWKRHRNMDNILLNTSLCLPSHLKLPAGLNNPNIVFANMNIHTSTICLHQAAIFKADKNRLPSSVSAESKVRCITAANEIASIMRMVSHMDLSSMNPFISFCLYVAARVFVQYLKSRPDDSQTADSLRFLLSAMNALKRKNPLTESFLVQLDVDLEALGMRIPKLKSAFPRSADKMSMSSGWRNAKTALDIHSQPNGSKSDRPSGEHGSLPYRNECHFLKLPGDDGNPFNAPDIVNRDKPGRVAGGHGPNDYAGQNWLSEDQQLPMRKTGGVPTDAGMMISSDLFGTSSRGYMDAGSSGETNDTSVSPNAEGVSNRPTPNSSAASDQRQSAAGRSGGTPFDASPIGSHQNLGTSAEMDAAAMTSNFFPDSMSSGFSMSGGGGTGLTPGRAFAVPGTPGNDFTMPDGWDVNGQTMTPVEAGMLHQLMDDMPSLQTMDLSGWVSGA
ncbi:hypothetical protein DL766_010638 [Monosporascus sp. MC13-8B]|uniref:Zn(2)-C6 fungal-type domain-containing protein n=1 Tax=Monosporascus cannonballus TaxID=155416 RepID=A0ABY0GQX7_9PEZI|nr:hypothetical protein DL762_010634 [Monosporascus cannonballus]RYO98047.1 hypothetical protein DL763_002478 [Monosporascus cannonballus]RYP01915.1 hypothetical protein DL766_010638 [Monosporascus sp. MC13-8B]